MDDKKTTFTIAVIEDDRDISKLFGGALEKVGFSVIRAFNGEEGLSLVLSQKPDLILLDISMPKMDGMTMMKKLREAPDYGKQVPIILLTNLSPDDEIMRGIFKDEPAYYLVKSSCSPADVVAKVRERLGV